ncbi:protein ripply2-like [Huso huso]|uniref:Protein ripply2-like n=1 Tax=Huso huso TaxID=61971 RepID=A0ABR0ZX16_HUSHU
MQNNHIETTVGLTNHGFYITSVQQSADRSKGLWRPWAVQKESHRNRSRLHSLVSFVNLCLLFWPKSKCYDYMYQEAKALLRNYPVQDTISFYEDSDSDDESDSEEEEELN